MALTVNNFTGFETRGAEEAAATSGTPTYSTSTILTDGASLEMIGSESWDLPWIAEAGPSDAGTNHIFGFRFRAAVNGEFKIAVLDDSAAEILNVTLNSSGNLVLNDANGSALDTSAGTYDDATEYFVVVYAALNSASAAWEWWIGTPGGAGTSEGSGSGADLTDGNAFGSASSVLSLINTTGTNHFDDVYILSGATATTDRIDDAEVFTYQNNQGATAAPDGGVSGAGTSGGDNLGAGTWDGVAQTPYTFGTPAVYSNTNTAGSVDLTSHTADVDGDSNIIAVKGGWYLERSNGSGSSHYMGLGDSGDTDVGSTTVALATSAAYHEWLHENVPTSSQTIRQGYGTDGGRNTGGREMWASLLHAPTIAGDPTAELNAGGVTATGNALTHVVGTNHDLNAGTASLTGNALTHTTGFAAELDAGAYTQTGNAITHIVDRPSELNAGAVTQTGNALTHTVGYSSDLANGSFTQTGNALTHTTDFPSALNAGSVSLTGNALTHTVGYNHDLNAGAVTLTGNALTHIVNRPSELNAGSVTLTGNDITHVVGTNHDLNAGSYTLTGNALTHVVGTTAELNAGAVTLTGNDITHTVAGGGETAELNAGSITQTGNAITHVVDFPSALDAGGITLTGNNITHVVGTTAELDAGSVTQTGNDLTHVVDFPSALNAGAITQTGNDITHVVGTGLTAELDAGVISLAGYALTHEVSTFGPVSGETAPMTHYQGQRRGRPRDDNDDEEAIRLVLAEFQRLIA